MSAREPIGLRISMRPTLEAHHALHDILDVALSTHVAVVSGPWSDPATWDNGVPGVGAQVLIPGGVVVTLDTITADLRWVHLDGSLVHDPSLVTDLRVDTLVVFANGDYQVGSTVDPVVGTASLTIVPHQGAPIDHAFDPFEITRGLIVMGGCRMHGQPVTPWDTLGEMPIGTTSITLTAPPTNWAIGDRLVLSGAHYNEDENFTVTSISGNVVGLDHPTVYARSFPVDPQTGSPYPECHFHVMHLDRNVVIRSSVPYSAAEFQAKLPVLQGHVMFMRSDGIDLRWVEFADMGRTTIEDVTDPIVFPDFTRDANLPTLCNVTTENVRARYACHFHKARPYNPPAYLQGLSLHCQRDAGLKVGVDNHSSNVVCEDSVAWQIDGSAFFTEEGDEVGAFRRCGAIHSLGSNTSADVQPDDNCLKQNYNDEHWSYRRNDYGHRGFGFWIHSGGIDSEDLWAQGHGEVGFTLFTELLSKGRSLSGYPTMQQVEFDLTLHRSAPGGGVLPSWATLGRYSHLSLVPGRAINLESYGNKVNLWNQGVRNNARRYAFMVWTHGKDIIAKPWTEFPPRNEFRNWVGWNTEGGVITGYSGWAIYDNILLIRNGEGGGGAGSSFRARGMSLHGQSGNNTNVENTRIDGFDDPIFVGFGSVLTNVTADGVTVTTEDATVS